MKHKKEKKTQLSKMIRENGLVQIVVSKYICSYCKHVTLYLVRSHKRLHLQSQHNKNSLLIWRICGSL